MTTTRGNALLALSAFAVPGSLVRAATTLKISYTSTPEFGAVFIAKEREIFTKNGLDVTLVSVPVAPKVPAALMSDSVQIGGATTSVLL